MVCYVCGTLFDDVLTACPACLSPCLDLSDLSHPGLARLISPTLSDMYLRGDLAVALSTVPRAAPAPVALDPRPARTPDAEPESEPAPPVAFGELPSGVHLPEVEAAPIVLSSSTALVLYTGPDGNVDTPRPPLDLESSAEDQLFGPVTGSPRYLSLDAEVRRAALGIDDDDELTESRNWLGRLNERLSPPRRSRRSHRRPRVRRARAKADPKAVRMLILTTALVGVTTLFGLQTLGESRRPGVLPTVTLPPAPVPVELFTGPELATAFADQLVTVVSDSCGSVTSGPGVLIDATHVVTLRSVGAGDATPTVVVAGADVPATLLGWGWSPDVAVIELPAAAGVDLASGQFAPGDVVADYPTLTLLEPSGTGSIRPTSLSVTGVVDGWAGPSHAVSTDLAAATPLGSVAVTGAGELAGIVSPGPDGSKVLVTGDALSAAIEEVTLHGTGTASCTTEIATPAPTWSGSRLAGDRLTIGSDAVLDALYDACTNQGWNACDDLGYVSDPASAYNAYADTCGGRLSPEDGTCSLRNDLVNGASPGVYLTGDCVVLARAEGAVSRPVTCEQPHDAQIVHMVQAEGLTTDAAGELAFTPEIDQQVADACAAPLAEWTDSRYWDRSLLTGVARPPAVDRPFACFVYQPDAVLTTPMP